VRERLAHGDVVVALGGLHQVSTYQWYLGKVDYVVVPSQRSYYCVMKNGVEINYVTGSRALRGPAMVQDLLETAPGSVWLVGDKAILTRGAHFYHESELRYFNTIIRELDFVGRDNRTFAARLK
jgi:hypothetical protein